MKKKVMSTTVIVLVVLLSLAVGIFVTDYYRSQNLKIPIFAKATVLADDGGSGTYQGLFYRVTVEKHLDTAYGVTIDAVTMYLGDKVVAASIANSGGNEFIVEEQPKEDWGLTLIAKAVTADGMTVIFEQSGGTLKGELMTGEWFALEKKTDTGWETVQPLPAEGEYVFNSIGYGIPSEGSFELPVLWKWRYGSLEPGEYRMIKSVMDFIETGAYTQQEYDVAFTVE